MNDQTTPAAPAPPRVEVRLSSDKLQLLVTVDDPHGNLVMAASRVAVELPALELVDEPDHGALQALLQESCEPGESLEDYPLLEGTAPVPPVHGSIEWARDFFAAGFEVDEEHDTVDYWQRAENRALTEGEPIAVLVKPREGKPGMSLLGNEIPVEKPKPAKMRAGKGVRVEETEEQTAFFAAVAGRLSNKDGNIGVENVYAINGDVNLTTGNIQHTGTVTISGDVQEGATIEVDGDLFIKGLVEACTIVCGGDLVVSGGIVGDGEHAIEVGGSVQARYLNDVTLRCGGDVTVTSQIDHCHIKSCGKIDSARGRIAGGSVQVYQGGRIGHAGAPGATGTEITIGANWKHEQEAEERHTRQVKLQDARDKLAGAISHAAQQGALDDHRRDTVIKLQAKLKQVDDALTAEGEAQNTAALESIAGARREFGVLLETHSGVTFRIGASAVVSDRRYELPRLIAMRRDKVRILPMGDRNEPD